MKERKKTFKRRALAMLMALVMAFGLAQTVAKPIDAYANGSVVISEDDTFDFDYGILANDLVYNGSKIEPIIQITDNLRGKLLNDNEYKYYFMKVEEGDKIDVDDLIVAGEYVAVIEGIGDYTGTVEYPFVINPKEIGIDWTDTELEYTGDAQKPTATATGLIEGDSCNVTIEMDCEATTVGEYLATATELGNPNYKLPDDDTITKCNFKIVQSSTFDGDKPDAEMEVPYSCKFVSDVELIDDWTWSDADKDKELTVGTPLQAVAVYDGDDSDCYTDEAKEATVAITRKACEHPNTELSKAKEASCTEDGYSGDTICSDCGVEIEKGQVIPAGHNKKHVAAKASTCTKKGNSEYWSCDKCGKYFSDEELTTEIEKNSWILPLEDHNMTYHTAKEPDCTNAGNIEYWSCDKCGKCFSDKDGKTVISKSKSVIKAKGHTLIVRNKKDATKLSKGYTGDTYCSTCSRLISTGKEIDKLPDEVEKNKLVKTTKGSKYYKEDGSQAKNEWVTINGVPYYFNEDGYNASNEWRDGKWISSDGSCTYEGELVWKSNSTGWWIEDTAGWYPTNSWQKIDGVWYYFNASGYMASSEYYNGYWFNADGSWDENYYLTWRSNSTGWWVEDISGWWPSNQWLKIDGYWYYFDGSGYMVTNQYVGGFWIGADGTCR